MSTARLNRLGLLGLSIAAVTFAAASATAVVNVPFSGVWGDKRGPVINFPLIGPQVCAFSITANVNFAPPGTTSPGNLPTMDPFGIPNPQPQNPGGCEVQLSNNLAVSTGVPTGPSNPVPFQVPTGFFTGTVPGPGLTNKAFALVPNVLSVQTRNVVTGPLSPPNTAVVVGTPATVPGAAALRSFKKNAWMSQSGRVGPNFTWCWGVGNCPGIGAATTPAVVKYRGGSHNFGGTMGLVLNQAFGQLALVSGTGVPPGGVAFLPLQTGQNSIPEGRGYGAYQTNAIPSGTVYLNYMVSGGGFITMATTPVGVIPAALNFARGFPWTTGTVFVRKTGTRNMVPDYQTLSAMGADNRTPMGMSGNINLVGGSITRTLLAGSPSLTPNLSQLNFIPEPGTALQALSGVLALLGLHLWRSRRS